MKEDTNYICREAQIISNLLNCKESPIKCDVTDIQAANNKAIKITEFWSNEI